MTGIEEERPGFPWPGDRGALTADALPEETILSPFLQKLSGSAPFLFLGVLVFGALAWRPTTAPIELETLASAWHMQLRDTLVPLRNGLPTMEIPPLLHWLILAGWQVVGINEWWPRLIPALAGLATVLLASPRFQLELPVPAREPPVPARESPVPARVAGSSSRAAGSSTRVAGSSPRVARVRVERRRTVAGSRSAGRARWRAG